MANVANIKRVTGLVLQLPASLTEIVNAFAYNRTPLPQNIAGSGGADEDPVGPQRWPLKL